MLEALKAFRKKLTNLSSSNKSLLHLRSIKSQDIDLTKLDFLEGSPAFSIIENLILNKQSTLCKIADSRDESGNETSRNLQLIERSNRFIIDEKGSHELYVGWPFIHGELSDDTYVRCPLLYFPVNLERTKTHWKLKPRKGEQVMLNKSFLLAYSYFTKQPLSNDLLEASFEDFQPDSQGFRNDLYEFLKMSPLEINFNRDLFEDRLIKFVSYKKQDYAATTEGLGKLKLYPEAVLGLYPQSGSALTPDYDFLIDQNNFGSFEEFFLSRNPASEEHNETANFSYQFINQIKEEQLISPFKLDAAQENVVKAVKKGHSLVVHGPPGTGKSQLISNLVADFTAKGKRVLVVCQKKAALDVVHKRLSEKNIGQFSALVHDHKKDRKQVYELIDKQIERLDEYKSANNSLDSIEIERKFSQESRTIDSITEELEEFKWALFNTEEFGRSPKDLYLNSSPNTESIELKIEYRNISSDDVAKITGELKYALPFYKKLYHQPHPLKDRVNFSEFNLDDKANLKNGASKVFSGYTEANIKVAELLSREISLEEMQWVSDQKSLIKEFIKLLKSKEHFKLFQHLINTEPDYDWFLLKESRILSSFKKAGMELTLKNDELGEFQHILKEYSAARQNILHRTKYFFTKNKQRYWIKRVLVANDLEKDQKSLQKLEAKLDNRLNFEHNVTSLHEVDWISDIPTKKEFGVFEKWFDKHSVALEAKKIVGQLRSLGDYLNLASIEYDVLKNTLSELVKISESTIQEIRTWDKYFTPTQQQKIAEDESFVDLLSQTLDLDFDAIVEFDKLESSISIDQKSIINKLIDHAPDADWEQHEKIFVNSLHLAWIYHFEAKYPILKLPLHDKIGQLESTLQASVEQKLELSKHIIGLRLREQAFKDIEYNRLQNRVTYRDLQHQVSKKRTIWPIRKLIDQFESELFDLIPCWLASPETVSFLFPMEKVFDLVIFDEASQCFSEKGLPTIYRGKQVVITGDDKQLSPFDLYQIRYEDSSEEDDIDLEKDSLLDLGKLYLMQLELKGHYRSHSLDLIDFSNQHFYGGNLELIQSFTATQNYSPAISFHHVNGSWHKGTNHLEATEVVKKIFALLKETDEDIGVITFNYKQQQLITDILEEQAIQNEIQIPESLFIKNIENVQGDERDIIIFSLGYAPDAAGKVSIQFGSLNQDKGENRLNVAVTRARKKIHFYSSLLSQQLNVEKVKNNGPKLLKEYIAYAKRVSDGEWKPTEKSSADFQPNWFLKHQLASSELNTQLVSDFPFADLSAYKNDKIKGVVLTDDHQYYSSISAKEKHAYLPLYLQKRDWVKTKVWSREFWQDPENTLTRIDKAFHD